MPRYTIYVPAPGVSHDVRPASAIVGERRGDMVDTHYEGGGPSNVRTFEEKLHHAAGRRQHEYPTSARRAWRAEDLIDVGVAVYDDVLRHWVVETIRDEKALADWLEDLPLPTIGGDEETIRRAAGQIYGRLDAQERARISAMGLGAVAMSADIVARERARIN